MMSMNKVNVIVIMCVYKSDEPEAFKMALDSILEQTLDNHLLVYQDGHVPNELQSIISEYKVKPNVTVFSNPKNMGLAHGLNFLIEYALNHDFDYIARMDSDDISHPTRLEKQFDFMENNQTIDVLGASCREFGSSFAIREKHLPTTHDKLIDFSIVRCPFIHPTVFFRRRVFEEGNRYPIDTKLTEDMALWFLLLSKGYLFANVNDVLLDFRVNDNLLTRRKGLEKALSEIKVRTKFMLKLKKLTLKNLILISSRIVFHFLPIRLLKLVYKYLR